MNDKDRKVIQKMIKHACDIRGFIECLNFESFMNDGKTISACAFTIGQIGELVIGLDMSTLQKNAQIPWKSIKGMRNRIVHDYENVDMAVLWGIVSKSMPELEIQLKELLSFESEDTVGGDGKI